MSKLHPAEPVVFAELATGAVYFLLNFFDDEMLVPDLRTVVYIGIDVDGETNSKVYFQDYESFIDIGPFPDSREGSVAVVRFASDKITCVFELDKAIDILADCQMRRAKMKR